MLNGLYDAKMDHAAVVAIVGQAATKPLGGSYQQEVDLQQLLEQSSPVMPELRRTGMLATS